MERKFLLIQRYGKQEFEYEELKHHCDATRAVVIVWYHVDGEYLHTTQVCCEPR